MAATPPTPPGANNFQLNGNSPEQQQQQQQQQQEQENNTSNKSNNNNNKTLNIAEALQQSFQFKALLNADENQERNTNSNINTNSNSNSDEQSKPRLSCACTNISIMHLFHEMKQEFPTLPDALVTQCVNENCHQRDNCIQMLRKELSLHPSPVQSYPAKVVQQQQHLQQRPLKPLRAAPTTPPTASPTTPTTTPTTQTPPMPPTARPRPTTLNLQRQINAQLQQKLQQRQLQQQQQQQLQALTTPNKPLRRAPPLPPLPPPRPATTIATTTTATTTTPSFSNDSSCLTSPLSSSESELSLNVSLSSPTTAAQQQPQQQQQQQQQQMRSPIVRHRSVINLQPEPPYAREFLTNAAVAISPVAAISPTTTTATTPSSSGQSTPSGNPRKSFTSLNLTLRQPLSPQCGPNNNNNNNNIAVQPSTIDITAGPAASGNGSSGITYSSSSFDARRGTHKNFQLTVTDEGSVFTAGCVRPQTPLYPPGAMLANDVATPPPTAAAATAAAAAATTAAQQQLWEQLATAATAETNAQVFPYATLAQKYVVATNYNNNHLHNNNNSIENSPSVTHMPLYEGIVPESDRAVHAATIERQKTRRDKLANALRDNKKRLLSLEQEINILTEPVPVGESERLDRDIKKLTDDCQRLLNIINDPQLNGTEITAPNSNSTNRQLSAPAGAQLQPFHQQRTAGQQAPPANVQQRNPMPPNSLRLHSVPSTATQPHLDFVQHHASSVSAPSSACLTPQMQQHQQQQLQQMQLEPPPTYAQYYQFQQFLRDQRAAAAAAAAAAAGSTSASILPPTAAAPAMGAMGVPQQHNEEEESLSESEVDEGEEPLDMWACNLCTFRNHPQLNICEACDNVRIQPAPMLNREDIHITLSPGENRIIHSWILS